MGFYSNGVGWVRIFLADTQSRLYPHMRAKFGRDPTAVSKKVSFKFIIGCVLVPIGTLFTVHDCTLVQLILDIVVIISVEVRFGHWVENCMMTYFTMCAGSQRNIYLP